MFLRRLVVGFVLNVTKYRMRLLITNFRHKCRKLILDGKDRESVLTPRQWIYLKETMCAKEFLEKNTRGKKGRDLVKGQYFFGQGGLRAKQHICVSIWCFFLIVYIVFFLFICLYFQYIVC